MIQSIIFNKEELWDTTRARRWLNKNKFYPIKRVHESARFYRYRIKEPDYDRFEYRTHNLGHGIKVIRGIPYHQMIE